MGQAWDRTHLGGDRQVSIVRECGNSESLCSDHATVAAIKSSRLNEMITIVGEAGGLGEWCSDRGQVRLNHQVVDYLNHERLTPIFTKLASEFPRSLINHPRPSLSSCTPGSLGSSVGSTEITQQAQHYLQKVLRALCVHYPHSCFLSPDRGSSHKAH